MLTKKQLDLLEFIHKRVQRDGVPPSFDEMKEALLAQIPLGRSWLNFVHNSSHCAISNKTRLPINRCRRRVIGALRTAKRTNQCIHQFLEAIAIVSFHYRCLLDIINHSMHRNDRMHSIRIHQTDTDPLLIARAIEPT